MTGPSVTYSGEEVALIAAFIAAALPALAGNDYDVADLLLDRALGALPSPLSPEVADLIAKHRRPA